MGSPLLLHNILSNGGEFGPRAPSSIYIRPSPFGSANPPIPVARSVTIARVASPNSTNVDAGDTAGFHELRFGGFGAAEEYVFADAAVEEECLLEDDA